MARLWTCGFEINGAGYEFEQMGTIAFDTTTIRSGVRSLRTSSLVGTTLEGARVWLVSSSNGPHFVRVYLRIATAPSAANTILGFRSSGAVTPKVMIKLNSDRTLTLHDEDGQIGSASAALSLNTWYMIELKSDTTAAAGSHVVEARLDGSSFASASNRNISQTPYILMIGGNLSQENQTQGDWYWDDAAWNDGSGSDQTSWPGSGKVITIFPNGAGDTANFTRGGSDSGANWSQCDENPPNDITDYVGSPTVNHIDEYEVEATPSEIASGDTINCVSINVRNRGASSSSVATFRPRVRSVSGGSVTQGSTENPTQTSWQTNNSWNAGSLNNTFFAHLLTSYAKPGGGAWTKADLDTMQMGIDNSAGSTNAVQMSAIWANVDFTPVAVTNYPPKKILMVQGLSNVLLRAAQ